MKKISSILLALAMLFTMAPVALAAGESVALVVDGSIYEGDVFEVDVVVTGVTSVATSGITLTYDNTKVELCDATGETINSGTWNEAFLSTRFHEKLMASTPALSDGSLTYGATWNFLTDSVGQFAEVTSPYTTYGFYFKALEAGDSALTITSFSYYPTRATSSKLNDIEIVDNTIEVLEVPNAPSVDVTGGISGTLEAGETVTANYAFDNGASVNNPEDDASEIVWYVGDEAVKEATADEDKTLTLTNAMVGKTIKYEVTPKVDRAEMLNPVGEMATSAESAVVAPADGYAPEATVTLAEETLAAVNVVYSIALDEVTNAFAVAEDETAVAWYIAEEAVADEAGLEGLEVASSDEAYAPSIEDLDKYVVLVVTPSINVDGTSYPGDAVVKSALITAEYPEIDATGIDVNATLKAKKTVSAAAVEFDAKMPVGAEGIQEEEITYTWYALAEGEECTEETMVGENAAELLLTDDMKDKFIVLTIDYTNELGLAAEQVVVEFVNAVKKASTNAPAVNDSPSLGGGGTVVTPPTEEPGEEPGEQPGDEPTVEPNDDPSGNAIANGAAAFTDVDKEAYAWAYEGIDTLAKAGVIKGMTETTFGPELTATNAQMIALAVRIAGLTAENATTEKVDAEHWVAEEAAIADAKGILGVYGDKVEVEEAVSREVAFTLLYNALKAAGVELPEVAEAIEFTDAASIDANCVEAIDALVKAGIVDGMGDGTLAPKATLTRAQLAKILGLADALITK